MSHVELYFNCLIPHFNNRQSIMNLSSNLFFPPSLWENVDRVPTVNWDFSSKMNDRKISSGRKVDMMFEFQRNVE